MAIAPIDLQTLFTQVDKVGKIHTAQKEGQAIHQAIQGAQIQRKTEEQIQQVNEAQDTGEGAEKIKDHTPRQNSGKKNESGRKDDEEEKAEEKPPFLVVRDPGLGNKIDISY
ncbi:MAG: hypothetical protein FWD26_08005 [Treponema sp.]|nr:hypothetical protein [Treponema sp.]